MKRLLLPSPCLPNAVIVISLDACGYGGGGGGGGGGEGGNMSLSFTQMATMSTQTNSVVNF